MKIIKIHLNGCADCIALDRELQNFNDFIIEEIELSDRKLQEEMIKKYNLTNIPTLLFEHNGEILSRLEGYITSEDIQEVLDDIVK